MDRPEWVAVHPDKKHVFCTLTNNKNRGKEGQPVGGPNPREKNNYGQIVRWMPAQGDHTSDVFAWDLYLIAGNPTVHKGTLYAGSENISADNMFNSLMGLVLTLQVACGSKPMVTTLTKVILLDRGITKCCVVTQSQVR